MHKDNPETNPEALHLWPDRMDPVSRLCTGVIDDLIKIQTNLLLGSLLIELTFETRLGQVSTLKNLPSH